MDLDLPISKVKRIAKFDPEINLVSQEAAVALTFATQFFIKTLAKHSCKHTQIGKRKTLQMKDLETALKLNSSFDFLDGVLETFSEDPTFTTVSDKDQIMTTVANVEETNLHNSAVVPAVTDMEEPVSVQIDEDLSPVDISVSKKHKLDDSVNENDVCVVSID